jgi:hypothetical protein
VSDGEGWEHVSVTLSLKDMKCQLNRCPTWDEMCFVKDVFWSKGDAVIQIHPPVKDHVNFHPFCLHLWRPIGHNLIIPPKKLIGG